MSKELLRSTMRNKPLAKSVKQNEEAGVMLDMAGEESMAYGAAAYNMSDIKMAAAAAIQQWVETDNLGASETSANRLLALMIGVADPNQDGKISDDEQSVLDMVLECAWDYLESKGVEKDDANALLNEWDNDAAERIRDLVASALPEGEDAASQDIEDFVFGSEGKATLDAAYKMVTAVRNGHKKRIRKRVSGTVRRTAAQKVATRKAQRKSHSAPAKARRAKSNRIREKAGL